MIEWLISSRTQVYVSKLIFIVVFRYEDEMKKKTDLENEFIVTKKVLLLILDQLLYCFASSFFTLCHLGILYLCIHVCLMCV